MHPSILWPGFVFLRWPLSVYKCTSVSFFVPTNGWKPYTCIAMTIALQFPLLHVRLLYSVVPLCSIPIRVYFMKIIFWQLESAWSASSSSSSRSKSTGICIHFKDAAATLFPNSNRMAWVITIMPTRNEAEKKWQGKCYGIRRFHSQLKSFFALILTL